MNPISVGSGGYGQPQKNAGVQPGSDAASIVVAKGWLDDTKQYWSECDWWLIASTCLSVLALVFALVGVALIAITGGWLFSSILIGLGACCFLAAAIVNSYADMRKQPAEAVEIEKKPELKDPSAYRVSVIYSESSQTDDSVGMSAPSTEDTLVGSYSSTSSGCGSLPGEYLC